MRIRSTIAAVIAFVVICLAGLLAHRQHTGASPAASLMDLPSHRASVPSLVEALRPVYPYSVIAGGAYSQEELKARLAQDPLARQHYHDFELERTRLVSVDRTVYAYVSYREDGRILWTQHRLRIPTGELLLTDGRAWARARCGNRLSEDGHKMGTEAKCCAEPTQALDLGPLSPDLLKDSRITFATPEAVAVSRMSLQPNWVSLFLPVVTPLPPLRAGGWSENSTAPYMAPAISGVGFERYAAVGGTLATSGSHVPGDHPLSSPVAPSTPEPGAAWLALLGLAGLGFYIPFRGGGTQLRR